jgi:SEC-C motif-containing protein
MSQKHPPNSPCPCRSGQKYKKCCRPYHNGQPRPTPEAVLRSRFSAYALLDTSYIMKTTCEDGPRYGGNQFRWEAQIDAYATYNQFVGLAILEQDENTITYRAEIVMGEADTSFIEKAEFRQSDDGNWCYYDGERLDTDDQGNPIAPGADSTTD